MERVGKRKSAAELTAGVGEENIAATGNGRREEEEEDGDGYEIHGEGRRELGRWKEGREAMGL